MQMDRSSQSPSTSGGRSATPASLKQHQQQLNVAIHPTTMLDRYQLWTIVESATTIILSQASLHLLRATLTDHERAVLRHELAAELVGGLLCVFTGLFVDAGALAPLPSVRRHGRHASDSNWRPIVPKSLAEASIERAFPLTADWLVGPVGQ